MAMQPASRNGSKEGALKVVAYRSARDRQMLALDGKAGGLCKHTGADAWYSIERKLLGQAKNLSGVSGSRKRVGKCLSCTENRMNNNGCGSEDERELHFTNDRRSATSKPSTDMPYGLNPHCRISDQSRVACREA